jgi:hypothetical protein
MGLRPTKGDENLAQRHLSRTSFDALTGGRVADRVNGQSGVFDRAGDLSGRRAGWKAPLQARLSAARELTPNCSSGCPRRRQLKVSRCSNWRLYGACHRWQRSDRMPAIRHYSGPHPGAGSPSAGAGVRLWWSKLGVISVTELMQALNLNQQRLRYTVPNFGRRHRHVLSGKLSVRIVESERWGNKRHFNRLHGRRQSAANGQRNANSRAISGCRSVSAFMSRWL